MEKTKIVNLENFFTEDNEKNGMWFEPKINGIPCGIEFLITGTGTDENIANSERFEKAMAETEDIKDPIEKVKQQKILDANRVAEFVKGIRAAEGYTLNYGGKTADSSVPLIRELLLKSPLIKLEIIKFAKETTNFIKREKNA